jgi:hypothetical protein
LSLESNLTVEKKGGRASKGNDWFWRIVAFAAPCERCPLSENAKSPSMTEMRAQSGQTMGRKRITATFGPSHHLVTQRNSVVPQLREPVSLSIATEVVTPNTPSIGPE